MDEQHATAGGRRGEALCERIAAGWSTLRTAVVDWLDEQTAFGVSRRAVIGERARTVAIATVGACATVTLWAWIGPGVVATAREIVEWTIASGPDQQDAVIAVVIGAVLIAWWIRWAARRRIASSVIARTASDHAVAALVGPGRVDERVARHEAAHAVVASALGAKVLRVRAIPDGTAGRCEWAFDVPGQSAVENAWVTLCALAAGEVEVPEGPAAWPGASSDTHEALAAATFIIRRGEKPADHDGPLTLDDLLASASRRAGRVLAEQKVAVDTVTDALVERRLLEAADLGEVLAADRGVSSERHSGSRAVR